MPNRYIYIDNLINFVLIMFCQTFYRGPHYIFKSLKGSSGGSFASHVRMTVTKQQLEFHYHLLILYSVKFCEFIVHVSFIMQALNFETFSKSCKSRNLVRIIIRYIVHTCSTCRIIVTGLFEHLGDPFNQPLLNY